MSWRGGLPDGSRPPLLWRLTARQQVALDVVAALAVLASGVLNLHPPAADMAGATRGAAELSLVAAACAAVPLRRRLPVPVMVVVIGADAALTAVGRSPFVLDVPAALAAYMVAARLERRWSVLAGLAAEAVLLAGVAVEVVRGAAGGGGIHGLLAVAAAWFVGDAVTARRLYAAGLAEQDDQRRLAAAARERDAVRSERVRIARELHDVVAHSLTVMTVQAGLGRRLLQRRPAETADALEAIEATGRTAQDELSLILRLLRDDDSDRGQLTPTPGLADLAELTETVRAAGTEVGLSVSGPERPLSPALELTVYRIIQEALTNVVKHAVGAPATVRLTCAGSEIRIEVTNPGTAPARHPGETAASHAGPPSVGEFRHGIAGMRERAAAFGGSLTAGRQPDAGFLVSARLPLPGQP